MAQTTLRGNPINTVGDLPSVGSTGPSFTLTKSDLSPVTSGDLAGQRVILNIFPSMDTSTCASSVRTFNQRAGEVDNTVVLCVSADLPFAAGRFCEAEGIENVTTASTFRSPEFLDDYGVRMIDGPLEGLAVRSVIVLDESGKVVHSQVVPVLSDEPDYDAALGSLG